MSEFRFHMNMRTSLLSGGLTALTLALLPASARGADQVLLVGWDFSPAATGWAAGLVDRTGDFVGDGSIPSNFSDADRAGEIFWDGSFSSTAFEYAGFGAQVTTFDGTDAINAAIPGRPADQQFTAETLDPNALAFNGVNGSFVIRVSTLGYQDLMLSYAATQQGDGSGAADQIEWFYSVNGASNSYVSTGITHTVAVGAYTLQTANLSGIEALDDQPYVHLLGVLAGSPGPVQFNSLTALDNLQITASPKGSAPVSFWVSAPLILDFWRNTAEAFPGQPGVGWIYDGLWPYVFAYGTDAAGDWWWVYPFSGDAQGFYAYNFDSAGWIYGVNSWGWYYDFNATEWKQFRL